MRLPDRHWWLWIVAACALVAGAVLVPYSTLVNVIPAKQRLGETIVGDVVGLVIGPIILCGCAALAVVEARRGRADLASRRAALAGDVAAMPPATFDPDRADIPDVAASPLVLTWRATRRTKRLARYLLVPIFVLYGIVVLGVLVIIVWLIFNNPSLVLVFDRDLWMSPNFLGNLELNVLGICGAILLMRYQMPAYLGRSYGVTATQIGISGQTRPGRRFAVRWDESRLFEVEMPSFSGMPTDPRSCVFRVYSQHAIAEWSDNPVGYETIAPAGMSPDEMAQRLDALIALVHARTGLIPRTCTRELRAAAVTAAPLPETHG